MDHDCLKMDLINFDLEERQCTKTKKGKKNKKNRKLCVDLTNQHHEKNGARF